jgi:hypothetical protein
MDEDMPDCDNEDGENDGCGCATIILLIIFFVVCSPCKTNKKNITQQQPKQEQTKETLHAEQPASSSGEINWLNPQTPQDHMYRQTILRY